MKSALFLILLSLPASLFAQKYGQVRIDSLLKVLPKMQEDTNKVNLLEDLSYTYHTNNPVEGIRYGEQGLALAEKTGWQKGIASVCSTLGMNYLRQSNYLKALEYDLKALKISEKIANKLYTANITTNIGIIYDNQGDYSKAMEYFQKALKLNEEIGNKHGIAACTGNIGNAYESQSNYFKALEYDLKALKIYEELGDKHNIAAINGNIGLIYSYQYNFSKAMEYYQKSLKINEEIGSKQGIAANTFNIGNVYGDQHNNLEALEYYQKALKINEETGNKKGLALNTGAIGNIYTAQGNYPKALEHYQKSLKIDEEIGSKEGLAYNTSQIGNVYLAMAKDSAANVSDKKQWLQQAIRQLEAGTQQAMAIGDLNRYQNFTKTISEAYALNGQYDKALSAFQEHSKYKDSVFGEEKKKEFTRRELDYEYSKRTDSIKLENEKKELALQKEIQLNALRYEYEKKQTLAKTEKERQQLHYEEELKRQQIENDYKQRQAATAAAQRQKEMQRKAAQDKKDALARAELHQQKNMVNASLAGSMLLLIAALSSGYAYRQKRRDNKIIADEKQRSEDLLLNILPAEVAEELKDKGSAAAKHFDSVSVIFTDFVNFTGVAEHLSPTQLVQELHECFTAFDAIIERNGLEKIKTIGDAYMAVCGLPVTDPNHARKTVKAALEIRNFISERRSKGNAFEVRIGVNSGSVVAGIVGVKKFAYDIWGDTVNTAARMEQHSEAGKVNISQATYELVKNDFAFEQRGKITAKNKGEIEMYFVESVNKNNRA